MACTATLREHINDVFDLLAESGLGGGCEVAYHAIVETGEIIRLANNYQEYAPNVAYKILAELMNDHEILSTAEPPGGWN